MATSAEYGQGCPLETCYEVVKAMKPTIDVAGLLKPYRPKSF